MQYIDKEVDVPVVEVIQVPQVLSELAVTFAQSVGSRQVALAESVQVIEIGAPLHGESVLPKVSRPDREALEAAVRDMVQVMEALQNELRMRLVEGSKKLDAVLK